MDTEQKSSASEPKVTPSETKADSEIATPAERDAEFYRQVMKEADQIIERFREVFRRLADK